MKKFLLLLLAVPTLASAQNAYVTDEFEITVRTGKGSGHKIVRILPTGKPVEILEKDEQEGYALIRTAEGVEGWVLARYLRDTPIARDRLVAAQKKIAQMEQTLEQLRAELRTERNLQKENEKLAKSLTEIREASANVIAINEENKTLESELLRLKRNMQTLEQENATLQDQSTRDWFMIGAGVLVAGVVLGLILPNVRLRRKRSSWSSL